MTKRGDPSLGRAPCRRRHRLGRRAGLAHREVRRERAGMRRCPPRRAAAIGSPPCATRSSTSCTSSCRSPGSSSSSQVRGAATVGRGRPRSEYGAIVVLFAVVLAPVDEHPARRAASSSCSTRRARGDRPRAPGRVRARHPTPARASACRRAAAYRWMPLLPLVTGNASRPMPVEDRAHQPRDLGALGEPHALARDRGRAPCGRDCRARRRAGTATAARASRATPAAPARPASRGRRRAG